MTHEFDEKTRQFLNNINKKIDELLERHDLSKEDIRAEVDERVEELKKTRDKIERELNEFGEDNKENFERIERAIGGAAREIGDAFKDIFNFSDSRNKEDEKDQT